MSRMPARWRSSTRRWSDRLTSTAWSRDRAGAGYQGWKPASDAFFIDSHPSVIAFGAMVSEQVLASLPAAIARSLTVAAPGRRTTRCDRVQKERCANEDLVACVNPICRRVRRGWILGAWCPLHSPRAGSRGRGSRRICCEVCRVPRIRFGQASGPVWVRARFRTGGGQSGNRDSGPARGV